MNKSHLTAITRKAPSAPVKWLQGRGLLNIGRILDYGCGKGFDAEYLACDAFDPYYCPTHPIGRYHIVLCTYVLNVLPKNEQLVTLDRIRRLMYPKSYAYISVRNDKKALSGFTKRGTYQTEVIIKANNVAVLTENSSFKIYMMVS